MINLQSSTHIGRNAFDKTGYHRNKTITLKRVDNLWICTWNEQYPWFLVCLVEGSSCLNPELVESRATRFPSYSVHELPGSRAARFPSYQVPELPCSRCSSYFTLFVDEDSDAVCAVVCRGWTELTQNLNLNISTVGYT